MQPSAESKHVTLRNIINRRIYSRLRELNTLAGPIYGTSNHQHHSETHRIRSPRGKWYVRSTSRMSDIYATRIEVRQLSATILSRVSGHARSFQEYSRNQSLFLYWPEKGASRLFSGKRVDGTCTSASKYTGARSQHSLGQLSARTTICLCNLNSTEEISAVSSVFLSYTHDQALWPCFYFQKPNEPFPADRHLYHALFNTSL